MLFGLITKFSPKTKFSPISQFNVTPRLLNPIFSVLHHLIIGQPIIFESVHITLTSYIMGIFSGRWVEQDPLMLVPAPGLLALLGKNRLYLSLLS